MGDGGAAVAAIVSPFAAIGLLYIYMDVEEWWESRNDSEEGC